jgi:protein-S-isoprenylcysteine O-methyltransferase Ste14
MLEEQKKAFNDNVHTVLAHSYASYFVSFLLGLFFHFLFPFKISDHSVTSTIGLIFLILATLLIVWAQGTSRYLDHEHISKESFCKGPYCYTRMPTHWGLLMLMLGFSLTINSFFVALFTLVFFFLTKVVFINRQESLLVRKYGSPYLEYKKSVKL